MTTSGPARLRISADHRRILDALERRDREALIDATDAHRAGAQDDMGAMLGRRPLEPRRGGGTEAGARLAS